MRTVLEQRKLWRQKADSGGLLFRGGGVIPDATEIARKTRFTDDLTAVLYLELKETLHTVGDMLLTGLTTEVQNFSYTFCV